MALNEIYDLDATSPNSNSNFAGNNFSEGMAPSIVNNGVRALASMIRRAVGYQSAAISSSVSTNIAAVGTGNYMAVTGANAINSFGTVSAGTMRFLEFSSSASISNGASILLQNATARKTQPGDIQGLISEGGGIWREFLYFQASKPMFSANKNNVDQTSISANGSPITFGTESFDIGGYFASDGWTPPKGIYKIFGQVTFDGTNGVDNEELQLVLNQDGSGIRRTFVRRGGTSSTVTVMLNTLVSAGGANTYTLAAIKSGAGIGTIMGTNAFTHFNGAPAA